MVGRRKQKHQRRKMYRPGGTMHRAGEIKSGTRGALPGVV